MRSQYLYLFIFSIVALFLCSCNNEEDTIASVAVADAYIRVIKINDNLQYAPVFYVEGNSGLNTVTVTSPDGKEYILIDYWATGNTNMRRIPGTADYSSNFPTEGTYSFSVLFNNGDSVSVSDNLGTNALGAFEINSFSYTVNSRTIDMEWPAVENSDFYLVRIASQLDTLPYFQSEYITTNSVVITTTDFKWYAFPASGEEVVISVHAFDVESDNAINSESMNSLKFTWE